MYIQTRSQFDQMLAEIQDSDIICVDTEGTGLYNRHGDRPIGIGVYIPHTGNSFYYAWGHGVNDHPTIDLTKPRQAAFDVYFEHFAIHALNSNMPSSWLNDLKSVWTCPKLFIGHNIQFDLTALDMLGFPMPPKIADTMSMLAVVNSDWTGNPKAGFRPMFKMPDTGKKEYGSRGLKWQARLWRLESAQQGVEDLSAKVKTLNEQFKVFNPKADLKISGKAPAQAFLWMLPGLDVSLYAEDDTRLTYLLYERILGHSREHWRDEHLHDLYNAVTLAVWQMQRNGFILDVQETENQYAHALRSADTLYNEILALADGKLLNPASSSQVLQYFRDLGVAINSTDKKALGKLADAYPIAKKILDFRTVSKLSSTYVGTWRDNVVNGKIHPEYNVGGTSTGRLSSASNKANNFQNIPRSSARGSINPKSLLLPHDGCLFVDYDYQALEMRLIAWVAETVIGKGQDDMTLTRLIMEGADMHAYTMEKSGVYDMLLAGRTESAYLRDKNIPAENVMKAFENEHGKEAENQKEADAWYFFKLARYAAKQTNFSTVYGVGAGTLSEQLEIPRHVAQGLLDSYHAAYPMVRKAQRFLESLAKKPRETFEGSDYIGQFIKYPLPEVDLRRKFMYYPTGTNRSQLDAAAWRAFSHTIQGMGGLIMQHAIVQVGERLGFDRIIPHATTHDSFTTGMKPDDVYLVPEVVTILENYETYPPLKVDVSAGNVGGSWGSVRSVKNLDEWIKNVQSL